MRNLTLTHGVMPTREQFDRAWELTAQDEMERDPGGLGVQTGTFAFGNDPRLGNCRLSQDELWKELQKAHKEYESASAGDGEDDPEIVGDWVGTVLYCLGIEWV